MKLANIVPSTSRRKPPCFIDLFAGCGGLSLGLLNAGWKGIFAVEKNADAFKTFAENLIDGPRYFDWPEWLPRQALTTADLLDHYAANLARYRGKIDLVAGGPPCQGFSLAGRRIHSDPRNRLTEDYLAIIRIVQPRLLLLENVQGFTMPFKSSRAGAEQTAAHSVVLRERLEALGYRVFSKLIDLSLFGVPQKRKRFIMVGVAEDHTPDSLLLQNPLQYLINSAPSFRNTKGLRRFGAITVSEAIDDLCIKGNRLRPNEDSGLKGFQELDYQPSKASSRYIRLIRKEATGSPNSMRLARHGAETVARFSLILKTCAPGSQLRDADRIRLSMKKQAMTLLAANLPGSTITTLPDDVVHYSEPRILTVRENARLQTFPDWFRFQGKYTSGGQARRYDCPRYSQVGNAVPPLFSEAVGVVLNQILRGANA